VDSELHLNCLAKGSYCDFHLGSGKSYMFDLVRTANEAYDRIRRILFVDKSSKSTRTDECQSPAVDDGFNKEQREPGLESTTNCMTEEGSCLQHCRCCQVCCYYSLLILQVNWLP
jgi:hypothetical protein